MGYSCCLQGVFCSQYIGVHGLKRIKLAGRYLFQRSLTEHIIDAAHGRVDTVKIANIAEIKLNLVVLELVPHVVLFFLVAAEDTDFANICIQESTRACRHEIILTSVFLRYRFNA